MNEQIKREECVYGKHWNALHGGYFSDPVVAAPLVRRVQELADKSGVDTIIDLGGGIGTRALTAPCPGRRPRSLSCEP